MSADTKLQRSTSLNLPRPAPKFCTLLKIIALLTITAQAASDNSQILDTTNYKPKNNQPLMTITPRVKELKEDAEEEQQQPQQEREFIHQKEHANPDKFQRKNKLKKEVEDIFYLDGSKQLRNEYIKENIRDQIDRKKKRTWSEVFGIVRDDPNSQEIVLCLALIFVFVGILSTLICCICLYWWQDRQRLQYLELTTPNYNTAEFKEHYN